MVIVYADDEPEAHLLVSRALRTRGHTVYSLDTSSKLNLEKDATYLLRQVRGGLHIDILILDGHNRLTDEHSQQTVEVTPVGLLNWLYSNGLARNCRYILFSNDPQLVGQARQQNSVEFAAAICKVGEGGGLRALLETIERE